MVTPNRISEDITQQTVDTVMGAVRTIHNALPFLVGLTPLERMRMNKAGDASQTFIRKSVDVAPHVADYLPRGFDLGEMRKDIAAMDALQPIAIAIAQLSEQLNDTRAILASEAFSAALEVYRCAKRAQGAVGIEEVVKDLGRRFARPTPAATEADELDTADGDALSPT